MPSRLRGKIPPSRRDFFASHYFLLKIFSLAIYFQSKYYNLTHTGKGREHGPRPRVPHASPGGRSPQVPSSASRKPLGAGKHATAGKGKRGWPGRRGPRKNGRVRHGRPKGGGRWRRERRTGGRQLRAARETKTLSDFTPPPGDRGREWNRKISSSTSRKGCIYDHQRSHQRTYRSPERRTQRHPPSAEHFPLLGRKPHRPAQPRPPRG